MNTEIVKFAPPKKLRIKMDNKLVINNCVYDKNYFEKVNEGKHCSNHKIPFNDVELVAKDPSIFKRIKERFGNSNHSFEQNLGRHIDDSMDLIIENEKVSAKTIEKRDKRLKGMVQRKLHIEKQKIKEKEEKEKQKEIKQIMEKKRIEKDPITKIQKNQDEKRKQTENLRKERYEQRLKEDAKPKIKRPRERSQRSQNNNESSNNSQDEADNRISMRRTDNRPSRNKSTKKDFEIVMLGKVIIDRDRNIIKNVGKWHMEPVDKHGSDEFSF